ncbi:MAG TPA: STAS domain-containing protein [Chitinivibrionales bacterium]|jgi:anti-anti-sigma factor|nr:STAS domain-containing protein [Chitinivibrionales bacterium]
MQFIMTSLEKNGCFIFYLSGDLDYEGAHKLREAFVEHLGLGRKRFLLNMEGLKIIASYSLSTILKMSYLAKKAGATMAIVCPAGNVWDVFYVLEIGKVIPLFPSEEAFWKSAT